MDAHFDLVIIGAGIVGLATAREAAQRFPGLKIAVVEKEPQVARHQTGHNSGVIHSGIYYQPGSLKARNCVAGAAEVIRFCKEYGLPFDVCGKVIVATDRAELEPLEILLGRGKANGIAGLRKIGPEELREYEPHCAGIMALHVPGTGITDFVQIALKYAELLVAGGGTLMTGCKVESIRRSNTMTVLETTKGSIETRWVVNCAGLHSDRVRKLAGDKEGPEIVPFRGEYYEIAPERAHLVRNLIYPVPDPQFPFLGVHFTRKIRGGVEAGPNAVLAFKREGYRKSDISVRDMAGALSFPGFWKMASRYWRSGVAEMARSMSRAAFARSLQKLVPEIEERDLVAGGSGVRAQALDANGKLVDDFSIVTSGNVIHVCNVPSPAATASLVIGRQIVDLAQNSLGMVVNSQVPFGAPIASSALD